MKKNPLLKAYKEGGLQETKEIHRKKLPVKAKGIGKLKGLSKSGKGCK